MKDISELIRQLRVNKKMNQQNVADDLGLSLTGYAKIERGETDIKLSRIQKIADYYELTLVDLFAKLEDSDLKGEDISEQHKEIAYLKEINQLLREQITNLKTK